MKFTEGAIAVAVIALSVALGLAGYMGIATYLKVANAEPQLSGATSQCDVTETTVAIGHQLATTILAAGSYQWAAFVMPVNATNTVSLLPGGTVTAGHGFQLTPTTTPQLVLGFAPNMPYRGAVTARSSTGSTTINVISCR